MISLIFETETSVFFSFQTWNECGKQLKTGCSPTTAATSRARQMERGPCPCLVVSPHRFPYVIEKLHTKDWRVSRSSSEKSHCKAFIETEHAGEQNTRRKSRWLHIHFLRLRNTVKLLGDFFETQPMSIKNTRRITYLNIQYILRINIILLFSIV